MGARILLPESGFRASGQDGGYCAYCAGGDWTEFDVEVRMLTKAR